MTQPWVYLLINVVKREPLWSKTSQNSYCFKHNRWQSTVYWICRTRSHCIVYMIHYQCESNCKLKPRSMMYEKLEFSCASYWDLAYKYRHVGGVLLFASIWWCYQPGILNTHKVAANYCSNAEQSARVICAAAKTVRCERRRRCRRSPPVDKMTWRHVVADSTGRRDVTWSHRAFPVAGWRA